LCDLQRKVDDVATRLKEQVVSDTQSNEWSDIVKNKLMNLWNQWRTTYWGLSDRYRKQQKRQKNKGIGK